MRIAAAISFLALGIAAPWSVSRAQSSVLTMTLGPNQIGVIKTAPEITTRISFSQAVKEVICGDLYDSGSGKGSFVVQRSGKEIFLKPVVSRGMSNMFVRTAEKTERIYNFDLEIVAAGSANKIVNVTDTAPDGSGTDRAPAGTGSDHSGAAGAAGSEPGRHSEEIIRNTRQQAQRIIEQAEQHATDIYRQAAERAADEDKQAAARAQQEVERRFVQTLMAGIGEARTINARAAANRVIIALDHRVLKFGDRSYLRYTIQNNSPADFAYSAVSLQATQGPATKSIAVEVTQNKNEFRVTKGQSLVGIVSFDSRLVGPKDVLTLTVRGDNDAEIAHLVLTQ